MSIKLKIKIILCNCLLFLMSSGNAFTQNKKDTLIIIFSGEAHNQSKTDIRNADGYCNGKEYLSQLSNYSFNYKETGDSILYHLLFSPKRSKQNSLVGFSRKAVRKKVKYLEKNINNTNRCKAEQLETISLLRTAKLIHKLPNSKLIIELDTLRSKQVIINLINAASENIIMIAEKILRRKYFLREMSLIILSPVNSPKSQL